MSQRFVPAWLLVVAPLAAAASAVILATLAPVLAAAAAPAAPAAAEGPAYTIKLARPVKVGDAYRFAAEVTSVQAVTANVSGNDHTLRPRSVTLRLEATERVLAVNGRGEPSKATYTVTRCVSRVDNRPPATLLDPGRVLTVEAGKWKSRLSLDEGRLNIDEEMALRALVSLPSLKDVTADDVYGTAVPRKVGETWAVNPEAMARWVSREGVQVDKRHVSGTVKLKGVQAVDGVPCLLLQGKAVVNHWTPEPADLPPETKLVSGTDEIKFTRLLPVDPTGHCLTDTSSERATMKVTTDDKTIGPEVLVDVKVLRTIGIKRTPLQAGTVADVAGE